MNQDPDADRNEPDAGKETEVLEKDFLRQEADVPLFLRDGSDGDKGDAQDEKDKTAE